MQTNVFLNTPAAGAAPPAPPAAATGAATAPPAGTEANLRRPGSREILFSQMGNFEICYPCLVKKAYTWIHDFIDVFSIEFPNDL